MKQYESPTVIFACRLINAGITHIGAASSLIISMVAVGCYSYSDKKPHGISEICARRGPYVPFS